ncbi:MAG: heavy-metal-associated domain-containing protein [Planctomycetota bacterium]|nr:heavy-metal-associated domain-containing protein [Planctomycetota bacterium]
MNNLLNYIVVTTIALQLVCCGGAQRVYSTEPLNASSVSFNAAGMGCPKCANNITLLLTDIDGVDDVNVNMGTGVIDVNFVGDSQASESDLATAVYEAGFTYKGLIEE